MSQAFARNMLMEKGGVVMKMLLAVDELDRSREALMRVADLDADAVCVLTVVPPQVHPATADGVASAPGIVPAAAVLEAPAAAEHVLASAQALLREHGIEAEVRLAHGDPREAIVAELDDGGYDLLVLGTRGSGLAGTLSSRIAEEAPCPVEIVGKTHVVRVTRRS